MNPGDIFNLILLQPMLNLIVGLVNIVEAAHIPGALGLSIVLLTVAFKLVTWPLYATQLKTTKKMSELKPHLDKLKDKHKDDKMALNRAQMELYKEHGVNPAGGCLPSLLQILIIIPLYQVIQAFVDPAKGLEKINHFLYPFQNHLAHLPDPNFLGLNLTQKPSDFINFSHGINWTYAPILLVPIVTGLLQFGLSKMMAPQGVKPYPSDSPKEKKEKVVEEDMAQAMQGQMLLMMPVMIGIFSYQFPIGVSLYYNVTSIVTMWQQYLVTGWGGLLTMWNRFSPKK